jgi:hypothetical protein
MHRLQTCVLVFVILLAGLSSPSTAKGQTDSRLAARNGVSVRATPSTDGAVIETLAIRTRVTVLESMGAWLKVATASKVGYAMASDFSAASSSRPTERAGTAPQQTVVAVPVTYQQVRPEGYKDPTTSLILSIVIPGGGQFYSGDTKKGAIIIGTALGGIIIGSSLAVGSAESGSGSGVGAGLLLGYAAYLGAWIYGMVDASDAAHRHNVQLGIAAGLRPVVAPLNNGSVGLGLSIGY